MRANSSISELSMKIIKPEWTREMRMKVWALEPDFTLVLITAP
ncbi:MAG TPA: outer membrane lipoprotein-sorting protein, partial [Caldithrix abyssi]|nr:outer membrane lipoprotein-sorting protein [Caldithrix abyssi]HED11951.1 outer membrane lipoprotein-sorting protein [Caldithrix abyssi]